MNQARNRLAQIIRTGRPAAAIDHFIAAPDIRPSLRNIQWFYALLHEKFGLTWAAEFAQAIFRAHPYRQTYEFLFSGAVPSGIVRDILLRECPADFDHRSVRRDSYALNLFSETCLKLGLYDLGSDAALKAALTQETLPEAERARLASLARALHFGPISQSWQQIDPGAAPLQRTPPPAPRRLLVVDQNIDTPHLQRLIAGAQSISILQFNDIYGTFVLPPVDLAPDQKIRILHARSDITRFSDEYRRLHQQSESLAARLVDMLFTSRTISRAMGRASRPGLLMEVADKLFFHMLPRAAVRQALLSADYDQAIIVFGTDQKLYQTVMSVPGLAGDGRVLCCCLAKEADQREVFGPRLHAYNAIFAGGGQLPIEKKFRAALAGPSKVRRAVARQFLELTRRVQRKALVGARQVGKVAPRTTGRPRVLFVANETRAYLSAAMDIAAHLRRDFDIRIAFTNGSWPAMSGMMRDRMAAQDHLGFLESAPLPCPPPWLAAEVAPLNLTVEAVAADAAQVEEREAEADAADAEIGAELALGDAGATALQDAEALSAEAPTGDDTLVAGAESAEADADEEEEEGAAELLASAEETAPHAEDAEGAAADDAGPAPELDMAALGDPAQHDPTRIPPVVDLRQRRLSDVQINKRWGDAAMLILAERLMDVCAENGADNLVRVTLNNTLVEIMTSVVPGFLGLVTTGHAILRNGRFEAVAICPGRPPRCFAFGPVAEQRGIPSITMEPHALNATYPRYSKISSSHVGIVSEYFRQEYDRNFGVSGENCYVVGSPRLQKPADYQSEAARAAAKERLGLTAKSGKIITFMSQPLGWSHLEAVWRTVVQATMLYDGPIRLLLKTHPEDTPARTRDYLDIAASLGAERLVEHIAVGPDVAMEASDVILTCYSVLAIEAMIRERAVIIVTTDNKPYPMPYHEIVGAPLCNTVDELLEAMNQLLQPGAGDEAIDRFKRQNPQFVDDQLYERINAAVMDVIRQGPPEHSPDARLASPFVRSEKRSFVV